MKKSILSVIVFASIVLAGCENSSDKFLSYEKTISDYGYSIDTQLTQGNFFAEDLAIVTNEENVGGDEQLTSSASLLVNVTDNEIIYADNVYDKLYPASLTKLLTSLVVLKQGELSDLVTVSYNATHFSEGNVKLCGFEEGDIISLEALLNSLLIYSGNDAAVAVADYISGSEEAFVQMMNQEAEKIGAVNSNFVNPHGLHDDNHYTTAYDMYLIFNELIKNDTFLSIINTEAYTAIYKDKNQNEKEKTFSSTNSYLIGDEEVDPSLEVIGGKTGTTRKAGNCLILLCKDSAGKEYIAIILNASGKEQLYTQMSHLISKITLR